MHVPSARKKKKKIAFNDTVLSRHYFTDDHTATPADTIEDIDGERNTAAAPEQFYLTRAFVTSTEDLSQQASEPVRRAPKQQSRESRFAAIDKAMTNRWHNPNKRKKKPSIRAQIQQVLTKQPEMRNGSCDDVTR